MNMKFVRWSLYTMFAFSAWTSVFGSECDSVLIPTREEAQSNHAVALSYLQLIDKSEYENLTHDGSAGLSIPIVKGLIEASTSYKDFLDKRKTYFEQTKLSYSDEEVSTAPIPRSKMSSAGDSAPATKRGKTTICSASAMMARIKAARRRGPGEIVMAS